MESLHLDIKNMFMNIVSVEQRNIIQCLGNNEPLFSTNSELIGVYNWNITHKNILLSMGFPIIIVLYDDGRREIVDRPMDGIILGPLRGI